MTTAPHRPLALVTGGSSGIGLELARALRDRGHDLVVVGSSERVEAAAEELRRPSGSGRDAEAAEDVEVTPVRADLTTYEGVEAVWTAVQATGRPLDVAALNAGMGVGGAFVDTDLDEELRMIALNVTSQVHLAKRVVQAMVARGSGRVLFTSSISATTPTPYEPVYGPTRAFVSSFADGLREELKGTGVSITTLLPGATDSEFHSRAGMGDTKFGDNSWKNDRTTVAEQGVEALMRGRAHVVGGDAATKRTALLNKLLPEGLKAARQGKAARPQQ